MSSNKVMTWWRAYTRMLDDDKIKLLAFEDRWHYVALCHMKRAGILDSDAPHRDRRIAGKLELSVPAALEAKRRIADVGLIDDDWHPSAWSRCQFESDGSGAERMRKHRSKKSVKRYSDNGVTSRVTKSDAIDSETESDKESEPDTPPLARGSAEGERAQQRARTRASKRMPKDFNPSTQLLGWAATEAPLVDFADALATIRDHEFKTAHVDWEAVVRNWLRRDQKAAEERMHRVTRAPAQEPLFRDDDTSLDGIEL